MFNVGNEVKVIRSVEDSDMVLGMTGIIQTIKKVEGTTLTRYKIRFEDLKRSDRMWWVDGRALELIQYTPEEAFWRKVKRWQ